MTEQLCGTLLISVANNLPLIPHLLTPFFRPGQNILAFALVGLWPSHHLLQGQVATNTYVVLINGTDVHTRGVVVDIHAAKIQIRPSSEPGTLRRLGSRRNQNNEPFTGRYGHVDSPML